jgi:hypothetical protein
MLNWEIRHLSPPQSIEVGMILVCIPNPSMIRVATSDDLKEYSYMVKNNKSFLPECESRRNAMDRCV